MAKTEQTPLVYEWPLMVAGLNRRASRKRLKPGELSLVTGVDGRYTGGLTKFWGMTRLIDFGQGYATIKGMWYLTMQKGVTDYLLRGFLVLHYTGAAWNLTYVFYDEDPGRAVWGSQALAGFTTLAATSVVGVAGPAKFAYIAVQGEAPRVLYCNSAGGAAAAFVEGEMGPGAAFDVAGEVGLLAPVYDAGTGEVAGGYLQPGTYSVGYRFYNANRGIYSGMSGLLTQTVAGEDKKIKVTNPYAADPDGAYVQGYTKLQVFRSMTAEVAGDSFAAGLMYLENEYALDDGSAPADGDCWPVSVEVGTTRDEALFWLDIYDPRRDVAGLPPHAGTIAYMEGVTFMGSDPAGGSLSAQIQWTQLHKENSEVFPLTEHTCAWDSQDGKVERFVRAGDVLYAFTSSAVFRIAKAGSQLVVSRMHSGRSLTARWAASELGRDILAVTDLGVSMFDGVNGTLQTFGALDRVLYDDWRGDLGGVFVAKDGRLGASFIVNPTKATAAVVWHVTGAITTLDDCNFVAACEGPNPVSGGRSRAWFVTANGIVVYADADRDAEGTMLGVDSTATLNGTTTGGGATTILDSTGTVHASMVGASVYLFAADGTWQKREIATVGTVPTRFTVTVAFDPICAAGLRYTVSPVPFRVRPWQLPSQVAVEEMGRRTVRDMSLSVTALTGVAGNENAVWRLGMCRNLEDTPGEAISVVGMAENPALQHANVNRDGVVLEPWVEHLSAGTRFELLSMAADGTITVSRRTS